MQSGEKFSVTCAPGVSESCVCPITIHQTDSYDHLPDCASCKLSMQRDVEARPKMTPRWQLFPEAANSANDEPAGASNNDRLSSVPGQLSLP
jgi:hypothetical protein